MIKNSDELGLLFYIVCFCKQLAEHMKRNVAPPIMLPLSKKVLKRLAVAIMLICSEDLKVELAQYSDNPAMMSM